VLKRIIPRDESFFDFFESHAATTVEACSEFLSLVTDGRDISGHAKKIKELESRADSITHDCLETLHGTFITPLERGEIHRLIVRLDDVMDFTEASADLCALYRIDEFTKESQSLARTLLAAAEEIRRAVGGIRNMKNAKQIKAHCVEIHRLENEADHLHREAIAGLFQGDSDPIHVIKWKDLYGNLESATDACEAVANLLEGIVLEHA
jgi:predicted phosphate transport protein (TIGR00153 family)